MLRLYAAGGQKADIIEIDLPPQIKTVRALSINTQVAAHPDNKVSRLIKGMLHMYNRVCRL